MTKQIFFILAVLCTLQAQASVQPVQVDTVQHTPYYNVSEERQPIQPVYLDGVVLPASRTGNWFVSIAGGTSAFLGTPLGCEDLFGRLKPSYSFAVGNGSLRPSAHVSITAVCSSKMEHCPIRTTTISMRICCGMSLAADMPGKNRYAGILLPLPVSACCTMPLTGIIPLLFRMAYRENIGFPNE